MAFGQEKRPSGVHLEGLNAAYTMVQFIPPYDCFIMAFPARWGEGGGQSGPTFLSSTFQTHDVTQDAV